MRRSRQGRDTRFRANKIRGRSGRFIRHRLGTQLLETRRPLAASFGWCVDWQPVLPPTVEPGVNPAVVRTEAQLDGSRELLAFAAEPVAIEQGPPSAAGDSPTAGDVFALHSNPGATHRIFLDFDGHVTLGTSWNALYSEGAAIESTEFSLDGAAGFSADELERIEQIWSWVAEDFSAFDVDVTTAQPTANQLKRSGGSDTEWGVRVVVGGDGSWYGNAGGVAFVGSFNWGSDTPVFVFEDRLRADDAQEVAEAISHESGHALGLRHDGSTSPQREYYGGHGDGPTSWAPIMGNSYTSTVSQWSSGDYYSANEQQDDLLTITTDNGFGYRPDDHAHSFITATPLTVVDGSTFAGYGIIEQSADIDTFEFETDGGAVSFSIAPHSEAANLDVWAGIYTATGQLIAQSGPLGQLAAAFTNLLLDAGTYYLKIDGVGSHGVYQPATDAVEDPASPAPWEVESPLGYSDYGSLGQYWIFGSVVSNAPHPVVESVVVNDGLFQRSLVTDITIRFNTRVEFLDQADEAIRLVHRGNGSEVSTAREIDVVNDQTTVKLTFLPGPSVSERAGLPASLADGNYDLSILLSLVASVPSAPGDTGITGVGTFDFGGDDADQLYRLFGDGDGSGSVDLTDFFGFRQAFGRSQGESGFNDAFDANGDETVALDDFFAFRVRLGLERAQI